MALNEFHITSWQDDIEDYFSKVHQDSMKDMPFINPSIEVCVPTLKEIRKGVFLGSIVTPWFINLVVKIVNYEGLDRHEEIYSNKVGEKVTLAFPSGSYEFIVNHNNKLGFFYTCALISDMLTLENNDVAVSIAIESTRLVFDEQAKEDTDRQKDIKAISQGEAKLVTQEATNDDNNSSQKQKVVAVKSIEEKIYEPVSRRSIFGLQDSKKTESETKKVVNK